ncbi:MAG: methylcobamide--CoM methyltransferase, partial [Lentisphaerae bacterium]|nr:methylcobamide--CoM methyltransferase [Lentisphaerota bacterium]
MLNFKTSDFVNAILTSKRRKVLPLMGAPGAELSGSDLNDAYKDGEIQFKCLEALYNEFPTEAVFTFMDLSLEAEAFGSPIEFVTGEVPTVSAPIVSDEESIDALN